MWARQVILIGVMNLANEQSKKTTALDQRLRVNHWVLFFSLNPFCRHPSHACMCTSLLTECKICLVSAWLLIIENEGIFCVCAYVWWGKEGDMCCCCCSRHRCQTTVQIKNGVAQNFSSPEKNPRAARGNLFKNVTKTNQWTNQNSK